MGNKLEDEIIHRLQERLNSKEFKGHCNGPNMSIPYARIVNEDFKLIDKAQKTMTMKERLSIATSLTVCENRCAANIKGMDHKVHCLYEAAKQIIENANSIVN